LFLCRDLLLLPESRIQVYEGGQSNYPDQVAHQAALAIEQLLTGRKETDLIIVLVSGEVMIFSDFFFLK